MLVEKTATKAAAAAAAAKQQPPQQHRRGAFIVLEGVDRCGKTTQSKLLLQRLLTAGLAAQAMRFPNRSTATGRIINEYLTMSDQNTKKPLNDGAIHLLFSANRWEASNDILEALANGTTIVCDRYAHSGVAFSSSKQSVDDDTNNKNQPLSLEWCRAPDRGLPAPDCVIYLQLSADQAEERGGYGGERYEKRDMQERVRERFMQLYQLDLEAQQQQQQGNDENENDNQVVIPSWTFVDAAQSVEQVQQDVWKAVQETLNQVHEGNKPVGKMFAPGTLQLPVVNDTEEEVTTTGSSDEENHEPTTTSTQEGEGTTT